MPYKYPLRDTSKKNSNKNETKSVVVTAANMKQLSLPSDKNNIRNEGFSDMSSHEQRQYNRFTSEYSDIFNNFPISKYTSNYSSGPMFALSKHI